MADIDVFNITDMSHLFKNTKREDFSGVENGMYPMWLIWVGWFACATSFNQSLASWDVSNVEKMRRMFEGSTQNLLSYWCKG